MDVRQARQIVEIWKQGTFGGAARELGISQPTLSRSVARAEDQLGVTLFERGPNGAKPTVFAEYIVSKVSPVLERMATLTTEIKQMARGEGGRVTIGMGPLIRDLAIEDITERIADHYPHLHVILQQTPPPVLVERLMNRDVDLIFLSSDMLALEPLATSNDVMIFDLFEYETSFYARSDHEIFECGGPITAERILDFPVSSIVVSRILRSAFPVNLSREQNDNLRAFQTNDLALIRSSILSGRSIGFSADVLMRKEVARGRVRRIDVDYSCTRNCIAIITSESWHSPVMRRVVEIAKTVATERAALEPA